ncbi:hypothetical protein IHN57_18820, partial [Deinococcus sp. 6GRE01]|nr:hypothetical protein [Deinococcus sp. 6GRE01]
MKLSSLLSAGSRTTLFRTGVTALTLASLLGGLTLPAHAAPRVGTHDGYTRLVFDLPGQNTVTSTAKVASQSVTVKLGTTLKSEQGALKAPGVTAYAVSGGTVTVTLAAGHSRASA